jgi:spore germination protein KC
MKRKMPAVIMLLAAALPLAGCWDRKEINDVAFVIATAIDLEPGGQYRVTVQVPLTEQMGGPKGGGGGTGGGGKIYFIDSDTGSTIREAFAKIQNRSSRRIFLAHRRVLIIGEELARSRGIRVTFEAISRYSENRLTSFMVVSKGKAMDLLNAQPNEERFSGEAIRELAKSTGRIVINVKNVAQALSTAYTDPLLLILESKSIQGGKDKSTEVDVMGYAHFRQDKMVDVFDGQKLNAINWLSRQPKPYEYAISFGKGKVNLAMLEGRMSIRPVLTNARGVIFKFHADGRIAVNENLSGIDLTDPGNLDRLKQAAVESLRENLLATLRQIQLRKTDPIGLGEDVWRRYPRMWVSRYSDQWRDKLSETPFDLKVNLDIVQIGSTTVNIAEVSRP